MSSIGRLHLAVDGQVFLPQRHAATQRMRRVCRAEALAPAAPHPVVLAQVPVHGLQTMVGLASDLMGGLVLVEAARVGPRNQFSRDMAPAGSTP